MLVVEDEYLIAAEVASALEDAGVNVIGPVGSVGEALELVATFGERLDGAVLDVNLRAERVYPVAQALAERGVRYFFTTGYDAAAIPESYANAPRYEKPVDQTVLLRWLFECSEAREHGGPKASSRITANETHKSASTSKLLPELRP